MILLRLVQITRNGATTVRLAFPYKNGINIVNTIKVSKMSWFEILKMDDLLKGKCTGASKWMSNSLNEMKDKNGESGVIAFRGDKVPITRDGVARCLPGTWKGREDCIYYLKLTHIPSGKSARQSKRQAFNWNKVPYQDKRGKILDKYLHRSVRDMFLTKYGADSPFGESDYTEGAGEGLFDVSDPPRKPKTGKRTDQWRRL